MPQILDQYGNPIDRAVLAEPQTAKLRWLKLEFAGHPSRGLTPAKLASILDSAEQGELLAQAELFADMEEKDGHILAEMGKRKRALLTIDWDVLPAPGATSAEKALAEEVKEWLAAREDLDDLIFDLLDAIGHAYSNVEIEWGRLGREWHPTRFHHRPPTWFQLDRETRTELKLRDNSTDGAALQPFGWITHVHKAKSGHIARAGLHRALAWPYLFKNYSVRDLAEFLEIYGLPLRVGTYPSGTGDAEKTTLLNAVVGIGHNAAGIIPQGMAIEFEEAAKGTHEPFQAMMDWCERTESKVIVGQVLSAEAKATGLGSGVATLHSEVRDDIKVSDARQLGGTLSHALIYPWCAINRGLADPRRAPRFRFDTQEPEDLRLYSEALPQLVGMGMKIPAAYAHERLKIPQPKGDEPVLTAPASPFALGNGTAARARLAIAASTSGTREEIAAAVADQVAIAEAAGELAGAWREDLGPMVEQLIAMAEQTSDLVTFRERLAELLRGDPSASLTRRLERSAFSAQLMGRTSGAEPAADLGERIVEAARLNVQAVEKAVAARPAPQPITLQLPQTLTVEAKLKAEDLANTLKPATAAVERLATAVVSESRAAREHSHRAVETVAASVTKLAAMQSQPPSWAQSLIAAMREFGARIEAALTRPRAPTEKTITAPDGRVFKVDEKEVKP